MLLYQVYVFAVYASHTNLNDLLNRQAHYCQYSGALRTGSSCFVRTLPKLPLGRVLSNHKQEGSCIYENNEEPWNVIKYLRYHNMDGLFWACTLPNSLPTVLSLPCQACTLLNSLVLTLSGLYSSQQPCPYLVRLVLFPTVLSLPCQACTLLNSLVLTLLGLYSSEQSCPYFVQLNVM